MYAQVHLCIILYNKIETFSWWNLKLLFLSPMVFSHKKVKEEDNSLKIPNVYAKFGDFLSLIL